MRVHRVERLEELRDDWDRLAAATGHPFGTWEWVSAWWERFGEGRPLYTFACRDAKGAVVAILPMYQAVSRPVRVARFLGYADLLSPLCAPEHRAEAARCLQSTLGRGRDRCSVLVAERLPEEQGWARLLGGPVLQRFTDPVLTIDGRSWDDVLATKSRKARSAVRRQERKLVETEGLTFRMAEDPARIDSDIDALFDLHSRRFGEDSTGVFEGERGAFQREVMRAAQARGWLRLWFAEIRGEPAAAYYGWRFGRSEWFFQSGRDPRYDKLSVGAVLLARVLREACDSGAFEFRFLAGDESYKKRFATGVYEPETRLIGRGPAGRAAVAAVAGIGALPDPMRERAFGLIR